MLFCLQWCQVIVASATATDASAPSVQLYVSPSTGSDSNAGTSPSAPLASLGAAIAAARHADVEAILLSGRLILTSTLTLNAHNMVLTQWPGQPRAVISGGFDVPPASWQRKPGSASSWIAPLSAAAAAALMNSSAGSIFVGGVRRNIIRTPTMRWNASLGTKGSAAAKSGFIVSQGDLDPTWSLSPRSLKQWRVASFHSWTKAYHTVKSVDAASGTIMFGENAMFSYGDYLYCSEHRYYIEGVPELTLTPGSWRLLLPNENDENENENDSSPSTPTLEYAPAQGEGTSTLFLPYFYLLTYLVVLTDLLTYF